MGKKKEKNKIFGSKLESSKPVVPECLEQWLTELEIKGGIETEGIFRISGSLAMVKKLREQIESGDKVNYSDFTIHDVAGVMKMYLRELQEPLFTFDLYACFIAAGASRNKDDISRALSLLPIGNRTVLHRLLAFLHKVVLLSNINKMIPENLSTCLVPNLLRAKTETMEGTISDYPFLINLFSDMIDNYEFYFKQDIADEKKKKDAIRDRALNYKQMMEKRYKKNNDKTESPSQSPRNEPEEEENNNNNSNNSSNNNSDNNLPVRELTREETEADLNFKNTMTAKYKTLNSNTLTKLGTKKKTTSAMEYKALLENQFERIQSGNIDMKELRDLLQLEAMPEVPRRSPPNYTPPKPPVPARKSNNNSSLSIHPPPAHRYSADVDAERNNNNNYNNNNGNVEGGRNRSWTSFEMSSETNEDDIQELLKTLPAIPSQLNINDKIGTSSPKVPPRPPPRSSTPNLK